MTTADPVPTALRSGTSPAAGTAAADGAGRLAAAAILLVAAWISVAPLRAPSPAPADAPPAVFSAARALGHVEAIAAVPHPVGSAAHDQVRDYLVAQLERLGLDARVQRRLVLRDRGSSVVTAAMVDNVVARLPGRGDGSAALLLAAHYDSVPHAPGASDNGAAVAALLETIRALRASPPLERDLLFLFSDAEEIGLLGAQAFVESDPAVADVEMVLNFEARGSEGSSILFETGAATGPALLRRFAASVPDPLAYSYTYDIYRRLPNDTDFSVFRRHGLPGFNFAFIDGFDDYHTPHDDLAHLDPGSLQHHGDYSLALAHGLGDADFDELTGGAPATYFRLPVLGLVVYPAVWALPIALLALAAAVAALVVALRGGVATGGSLALGVLATLAATAAGVAAAVLLHRAVRLLLARGDLLATRDLYLVGLLIAGAGAAWWVLAALARRARIVAVGAGALMLWAVAAVVAAWLLPSSAYLFAWPTIFAAAALFVASRIAGREGGSRPRWEWIVLALLAVPALLLWLPTLHVLLTALGTASVLPAAALSSLLVALAAPSLAVPVGGRRAVGALVLAAGAILAIAGAATVEYGPERPRPDSLFYAYDADRGTAAWASFDVRPGSWTSRYLDGDDRRLLTPFFARDPGQLLAGDAPLVELPGSRVEPVASDLGAAGVEDGGRRVGFRIQPAPGVAAVTLRLASDARLRSVWLGGEPVPLAESDGSGGGQAAEELGDAGRADLAIDFWAPPADGFEVVVELDADRPLGIAVIDRRYGLPAVDGAVRPRDTIPGRYGASDVMLVKKEHRL